MYFCKQTRPAAINLLKTVDLSGKDGVISDLSPGVFVQVFFCFCLRSRLTLHHIFLLKESAKIISYINLHDKQCFHIVHIHIFTLNTNILSSGSLRCVGGVYQFHLFRGN